MNAEDQAVRDGSAWGDCPRLHSFVLATFASSRRVGGDRPAPRSTQPRRPKMYGPRKSLTAWWRPSRTLDSDVGRACGQYADNNYSYVITRARTVGGEKPTPSP